MFPSQQGDKLGLQQELQGWLNVRRSKAHGNKWKMETGGEKRLPFPLLRTSNMTHRGHDRDD